MRFAVFFLLASGVALAESWSGILVDSSCYAAEQTNANKNTTSVDRDMNMEVRECVPSVHTKDFALILRNWTTYRFDSAGNQQAAKLLQSFARNHPTGVTVTGNLDKKTIHVSSASINQP